MTRVGAQSRWRHVAPAGSPIGVADLGRWATHRLARRDSFALLRGELRRRLAAEHCDFTSTGRAGMTVLLSAMASLAPGGRNEVVIPSYTCYSVAASILRAGLRPRIVDIVSHTLDYDHAVLARTDLSRVLAIVATNLYGLPSDMARLAALAAHRGVFLIDDAAQAMGARDGRWAGTRGDAGLYSFDKGKNVSAIDGGVVVSSSPEVAAAVSARVAALPAPGMLRRWATVGKVGVYAALLPPSLYWIPNAIPQLGLGQTRFTTDYEVEAFPRGLAALALTMLARLDEYTAHRREAALALATGLAGLPGLTMVRPLQGSEPAFLRFPVLTSGPEHQQALIAALNRAGIGATGSYPTSLADVPALAAHLIGGRAEAVNGASVAARIVTLPTHPYVARADLDATIAIVSRLSHGLTRAARRCG